LLIAVGVVLPALLILWLVGERGRLLLPSTKRYLRMGGVRRLFDLRALHGYLYLRLQQRYASLILHWVNPIAFQGLRRWFARRYHSKVLTEDQARAIISVNQEIPLQDLEQVIPYPLAREIVLSAERRVVAYECACRHARANPCTPTQVCLFIGEPFADFMLEHHPEESRVLTRAEALDLLRAEHERGHVHTAWFKDVMLDRFYPICNCCACCCGGIEVMVRNGISVMASSGYVARVETDLCTACGACVDACPFEALSLNGAGSEVDWQRCMGCGVCVDRCPSEALSLARDGRKGVPLDVRALDPA